MRILKEVIIKAMKLRILRAKEPIVKGVETKLKISAEEDV